MNIRPAAVPVFIAGLVMGLLGNLPFINILNCLLCLWVWLGGALAVVLYRRSPQGHSGLTPGRGAGLGAMAGLVGAVIGFFVFLLTASLSAPVFENLARALQVEGDLPLRGGTFAGNLVQAGMFLAIDLVLYPGFGALGGLIAARTTKPHTPNAVGP